MDDDLSSEVHGVPQGSWPFIHVAALCSIYTTEGRCLLFYSLLLQLTMLLESHDLGKYSDGPSPSLLCFSFKFTDAPCFKNIPQ